MSDTNLPEGTGGDEALTFDSGADAISDLLADPETDLEEQDQGPEAEAETEDEGEEPETEENAEADDEEGDVEAEEPDESGDIKGGRFAPDSAKVTLDDGTVTTIAELKRNNLFQRDYTRKTQELSEERRTFEENKRQADEYARQIAAQRDFLLQASQRFLPQPPDRSMMDSDPIGYMQAQAEYQEKMGIAQQLYQASQAEQARMQEQQQKQQTEIRQREAERLFEAMPELKNRETYARFWNDAVETMNEYGFTQAELDEATDHRFYKVFRDLMKYRKARTAAPKVREQVQKKPVMQPQKRMDPKAKTSRERQAKAERLRQTGDFQAGVAALMDLDL